MQVGADNWLESSPGDPVEAAIDRYPMRKTSALVVPEPVACIFHYTGLGNPEALAKRLQQPGGRDASWHLLIARSGRVLQSSALNVGTWHVGQPGTLCGVHYDNVNKASIGIETENAGQLHVTTDPDGTRHAFAWPFWAVGEDGKPDRNLGGDPRWEIDISQAVTCESGMVFQNYTPEQERSMELVLQALVQRFGWSREACSYGHVMFSPPAQGKIDPGDLVMKTILPRILDRIFGTEVQT